MANSVLYSGGRTNWGWVEVIVFTCENISYHERVYGFEMDEPVLSVSVGCF